MRRWRVRWRHLQWRLKHPGYMRAYGRSYHRQNYPRLRRQKVAYARARYAEKRAERLAWVAENRPLLQLLRRRRRAAAERHKQDLIRAWRAANRDQVNAQATAWRRANPDKIRIRNLAHKHRRRALKRGAGGSGIDRAAAVVIWGGRCAYCGCVLVHPTLDHIIPLSRGGDNHPENLAPACAGCNASKSSRLLAEWCPDLVECVPRRAAHAARKLYGFSVTLRTIRKWRKR